MISVEAWLYQGIVRNLNNYDTVEMAPRGNQIVNDRFDGDKNIYV